MEQIKELVKAAVRALEDKKGIDVRVIKVEQVTTLADYIIIANGTSTTHVKSLADNAEVEAEKLGIRVLHREGYTSGSWILLDYGSVIVNVFQPQAREYYSLERMWADGKEVQADEI